MALQSVAMETAVEAEQDERGGGQTEEPLTDTVLLRSDHRLTTFMFCPGGFWVTLRSNRKRLLMVGFVNISWMFDTSALLLSVQLETSDEKPSKKHGMGLETPRGRSLAP